MYFGKKMCIYMLSPGIVTRLEKTRCYTRPRKIIHAKVIRRPGPQIPYLETPKDMATQRLGCVPCLPCTHPTTHPHVPIAPNLPLHTPQYAPMSPNRACSHTPTPMHAYCHALHATHAPMFPCLPNVVAHSPHSL